MVLLLANMLLLTKRSLALSSPFCMHSSLLNTTLHSSARSSRLGRQLLSPPSKFSRVSKNLPQKAPWEYYTCLVFRQGKWHLKEWRITCQPLRGLNSLGSHLPVAFDFFTWCWIRFKPCKYGEDNFDKYLQILANQEAIGSGGDAKIVNVVAPRTTLAHLHAAETRG